MPDCGTALLSCSDLDAVCDTSPIDINEAVPLDYQPARALDVEWASLHVANTVMGANVPLEQIPKVSRSAVDATIHNRCVPVAGA